VNLAGARIGYVPYRADCQAPGDRRRFAGWARKRGVTIEVAEPGKRYDLVVVSNAADITVWARQPRNGARVVYDLIDSYLSLPRTNLKALLRGPAKSLTREFRHPTLSYWAALAAMCRRADAVVCTTPEQQREALAYCEQTHVILDLQGDDVRAVKDDYAAHTPFALVWEGLPVNLATLATIAPVVRRLAGRQPVRLNIVTDSEFFAYMRRFGRRSSLDIARRYFDDVVLHPWSAGTLSRVASESDLAVIPIPAGDALAMGKPANKLLLFWRMGVPAVTSATPAYDRAMRAAGVPLTCATEAEWEATLARCMSDAALRREAGLKGRAWATSEHSDDAILAQWDRVVTSLLDGPR
jgi:glycosyltransferase involved in cell wall biosynthesis